MSDTFERSTLHGKALQLILEMKRNPDVMPPYNEELMRACYSGINELYQQCSMLLHAVRAGESSQEALRANSYRHEVIKFVMRCCTAYIHARSQRIKSYRWKYGGILPSSIKNNLSEAENEFFNEYCASLAEFQQGFGENGLDLMRSTHPPTTLFLQVRVREDYGEFETSEGHVVLLTKGSVHSIPRQDCEILIKQGILERFH